MEINQSPPGAAAAAAQAEAHLQSATAGLAAMGSAESLIAQASVQLDEMSERARTSRRTERKLVGTQKRAAIHQMRKAARARLAAGIMNGAGSIAQGVGSGVGAAKSSEGTSTGTKGAAWGQAGQGAAQVGSTIATSRADSFDRAAKRLETLASEAGERAQDEGEAVEQLERAADKAVGHLESVARARHEAGMAAIRG